MVVCWDRERLLGRYSILLNTVARIPGIHARNNGWTFPKETVGFRAARCSVMPCN